MSSNPMFKLNSHHLYCHFHVHHHLLRWTEIFRALHLHQHWCCYLFFNTHKKEKKIKKNTRAHKWRKSRRLSKEWWWRTKITNKKLRGLKCIKLATQLWLKKSPTSENIFIWGKKHKFGWVRTQWEFWKT
jgi:hypothetical protein